jgi:hypothetical protein
MKKGLFLLSISILMQSCFSYKSIDYGNIEIDKKQKFEVKGIGGRLIEGLLVSKSEKIMVLENKGQLQTISKDEIYDIRVKKISFLKTAGAIVTIPWVLIILLVNIGN